MTKGDILAKKLLEIVLAFVLTAGLVMVYNVEQKAKEMDGVAVTYPVNGDVTFDTHYASLASRLAGHKYITTVKIDGKIKGYYKVTDVNYSADLTKDESLMEKLSEVISAVDEDLAKAVIANLIDETPLTADLEITDGKAKVFVYKKGDKYVEPDGDVYEIPGELVDIKHDGTLTVVDKLTGYVFYPDDKKNNKVLQALIDDKPIKIVKRNKHDVIELTVVEDK